VLFGFSKGFRWRLEEGGTKRSTYMGEFTLAVTFRNVDNHFTWAFAGVYGPNFDKKAALGGVGWYQLVELALVYWGDFNVARFPIDRSGDARLCPTMMEFFDFIFDLDLMDLPLVGGTYTWSNNWESPSWSRIDRFLVSLAWEAQFPSV
jgi:hypothetical protein